MNLWDTSDRAKTLTFSVYERLINGQPLQPVAPARTVIRPKHSVDEMMLASGQFELLEFSAVGDGTYYQHTGFAVGNPLFMGAFFGAQAIANANNRRAAERAATPQWHVIEQGILTVSDYGFYLETQASLWDWDWGSIDSLEVIAESNSLMRGQSTKGPVTWIIHSDWAELVFVLWAAAVHPAHPQFRSASFLSAECAARASAHIHGTPPGLHDAGHESDEWISPR